MIRNILLLIAVLPIVAGGCTQARAEPTEPSTDRSANRILALAARDARLASPPVSSTDDETTASCGDGTLEWERAPGTTFCATICSTDAMCSFGERCRVLDIHASPDAPTVFADDIADVFLEAASLAAELENGPIYDTTNDCDDDCDHPAPQYEIAPSAPLALCDPFFDEP